MGNQQRFSDCCIIDMKQRKTQTNVFSLIHRFSFSLATFTFTLATFCTLPLGQDSDFFPLYQFLLIASSLLMITSEVAEYAIEYIPMCSFMVFSFAIIGNVLNIWSAYTYPSFNKGEMYLVAAFFYSLACELKVLFIVLKNKSVISELLRQEKYRFIRYACLALGTIFFLSGSIIQMLEQKESSRLTASLANVFGGLLYGSSVIVLLRNDLHRGYEKFNHDMQIPRIV